MVEGDEYRARIRRICEEWDKAEAAIKLAEQTCNKVVWPSIKELRYAGRRIVDALNRINEGASEEEVNNLLQDAEFDCHRSHHDAIDAATSHICFHLESAAKSLGYEILLNVFPKFPQIMEKLDAVREKIRISRKNRGDREAIYSVIETDIFDEIISMYEEFKTSEKYMVEMAKKGRRTRLFDRWIAIVGALFGLIGIICYFSS